jgi:hypothetical protein
VLDFLTRSRLIVTDRPDLDNPDTIMLLEAVFSNSNVIRDGAALCWEYRCELGKNRKSQAKFDTQLLGRISMKRSCVNGSETD